jgi:hypothetical protein
MAAKLTRVTHKIAIQLHLVAESCTVCSSRSRRPVRKLLDTPSHEVSTAVIGFFLFLFLFFWVVAPCSVVDEDGGNTVLRNADIQSPYYMAQQPTTASRTALGPTQPPIQWVPRALTLGVKWPGREADHSLPSSAEVKEWVELYLHANTSSWRGAR